MVQQPILILAAVSVIAWGPDGIRAEEPASAQQWIQQYDTDGDGKLNVEELGVALTPDVPADLSFVRVVRDDEKQPLALETAVVSFRSPSGDQSVDLIGAIHVADLAYYQRLNRIFRDYDAVLYELIAPEGTRIPQGGQTSDHPIGRIQRGIKSMLDLSFQLDEVDYTVDHLVHADLSPEEFVSSMQERGESFLQILFRVMGQAASQAGNTDGPSDRDLLMALFAPDRSLRLKRILADQFQDLEEQMRVLEGPGGSTLIGERNKRALEVLRKQQSYGHDRVAIFYGAGHMSDMAKRLQAEFGLKYDSTQWLKAWDLSEKTQ